MDLVIDLKHIAKILMRSLYNSEKLHVNVSLLMQSF